ncbi:MAG: hypothetical protein ACI9GH_000268 [Candidatus Paceibacteria bacterium]|jgi:hypothetical protein
MSGKVRNKIVAVTELEKNTPTKKSSGHPNSPTCATPGCPYVVSMGGFCFEHERSTSRMPLHSPRI